MQNLILNRYRPLELAGNGGFGTVVAAWDMRIQRKVAIKCLRLDALGTASNPSVPRDIPGLEEARTAAMLSDPSIVGVYDFAVQGGIAYLIMEYMDGMTLTQLMRQEGALDLNTATCIFSAVARALQVAHENQVLHLDIKPDNILINRQGQVKVTDFGLAQLSHEAGYGQAAGGTIGYMPLEQMRLEAPDERTDEWALASLTYEMLMAENPFLAPDLEAAERAIEDAEVVIPSLVREDLDEEIDEAIFGALAIDREDRFETVGLFADAMLPHMGSTDLGAKRLAALVGNAQEDSEGQDEGATEEWGEMPAAPGLVRHDDSDAGGKRRRGLRAPKVLKPVVSRMACALICAFSAAMAVVQMPFDMSAELAAADPSNPAFWVVLIAAFAAMAALPPLGAALAAVAWGALLAFGGHYISAAGCLAAYALWILISWRGGRVRAVLAAVAGLLALAFGIVAQAYLLDPAAIWSLFAIDWIPVLAVGAALLATTVANWKKRP